MCHNLGPKKTIKIINYFSSLIQTERELEVKAWLAVKPMADEFSLRIEELIYQHLDYD